MTPGNTPPLRIGAVVYLNAQPLTHCLAAVLPEARVVVDVPSRLAEQLAAGALDVALVPSVEYLRRPQWRIVSDACIASAGAARSVKLYGRVPPGEIKTLALDGGSRTSAALARILLAERFGVRPRLAELPVGGQVEDVAADAVVLIGDRGMVAPRERFAFVWDLGEEWFAWTGLPLVFACWTAPADFQHPDLGRRLAAARDAGVARLEEIASSAAGRIGVPQEECLVYLRDHLTFTLGPRERQGLERFRQLAEQLGVLQVESWSQCENSPSPSGRGPG